MRSTVDAIRFQDIHPRDRQAFWDTLNNWQRIRLMMGLWLLNQQLRVQNTVLKVAIWIRDRR